MDVLSKECSDRIDYANAEQLHSAVLQMSKTCYDTKKLCITLLGVVIPLIKVTCDTIRIPAFVVGLSVTIGFWISDATAYYYQKRLRRTISQKFNDIAARNEASKQKMQDEAKVMKSLFNMSMIMYYIIIALLIVGYIVYR